MSPEEEEQHLEGTIEALETVVENHNRDLQKYHLGATAGSLGAVGATLALLAGQTELALISILSGGLSAIGNAGGTLDKIFSKPTEPSLYRVFRRLESASEERFLLELHEKTLGGLIHPDDLE